MPEIQHNRDEHRFEATLDGHRAELTYRLSGDRIVFTHTGVPVEFRGKGIAAALVKAGLAFALEQNLKVVPMCSYVAAYIKRNPEYQHLLAAHL
jgi:uncharacterized protein